MQNSFDFEFHNKYNYIMEKRRWSRLQPYKQEWFYAKWWVLVTKF